eukprot:gene23504-31856_t
MRRPTRQPIRQPSKQPSNMPTRPTSQPTAQPAMIPTQKPSLQPFDYPSSIPTCPPSEFTTSMPTIIPTRLPTNSPSNQPSKYPRRRPSSQPSRQPFRRPSRQPIRQPTRQPIRFPTNQPTISPSHPSQPPTIQPSRQPIKKPTGAPSLQPSVYPSRPSSQPSMQPTEQPSGNPISLPTIQPTKEPIAKPTLQPTKKPYKNPSFQPTRQPSFQPSCTPSCPSSQPSRQPFIHPTKYPSLQPSEYPSKQPLSNPSMQPSHQPLMVPSLEPVSSPSIQPANLPSRQPSQQPLRQPFSNPTKQPSLNPVIYPSQQPHFRPSALPTLQPIFKPSTIPSLFPSSQPIKKPTLKPTRQPSLHPTGKPSLQISIQPTMQPSSQPHHRPSAQPLSEPTQQPSIQSIEHPTRQPSLHPSIQPIMRPSKQPTTRPLSSPSFKPTKQPSLQPIIYPSVQPFAQPSVNPSELPSEQPIIYPSDQPTSMPRPQPSCKPNVQPTARPLCQPTVQPTLFPRCEPSKQPSDQPTSRPTRLPSLQLTFYPTDRPSAYPSEQPLRFPSQQPTQQPSKDPASEPTIPPTRQPIMRPTDHPQQRPSKQPNERPSSQPLSKPSRSPTQQPPSAVPSAAPSDVPSVAPTVLPTISPSYSPSGPSSAPTFSPSQPSAVPSAAPSDVPSVAPTVLPTISPSYSPSGPSSAPTFSPSQPSAVPSAAPSDVPSVAPNVVSTFFADEILALNLVVSSNSLIGSLQKFNQYLVSLSSDQVFLISYSELVVKENILVGGSQLFHSFMINEVREGLRTSSLDSISLYYLNNSYLAPGASCTRSDVAYEIASKLMKSSLQQSSSVTEERIHCDKHYWVIKSCSSEITVRVCVDCNDPCKSNSVNSSEAVFSDCLVGKTCASILSMRFLNRFPPPQVEKILPLKSEKNSVSFNVTVLFPAYLLCTASNIDQEFPQYSSVLQSSDSRWTERVGGFVISHLIPATNYTVCCASHSVSGSISTISSIKDTCIVVQTDCCKSLRVQKLEPYIFPGFRYSAALSILLSDVPSDWITIQILSQEADSKSCYFSPPKYLNRNVTTTMFQVELFCANLQSPGTHQFAASIVGPSAAEYDIIYEGGNSFEITDGSFRGVAPKFLSATFSLSGTSLLLLFDSNTNKGGLPDYFQCSKLLSFNGNDIANCHWIDKATIKITNFGPKKIVAGTTIRIANSTISSIYVQNLQQDCPLPTLCTHWPSISYLDSVAVDAADSTLSPVVYINGPSTVNSYNELTIDLLSSTGSSGIQWLSSSVLVRSTTRSADNITSFITAQLVAKNNSLVIFPKNYFMAKERYSFFFTLCNWFRKCSTGAYFLSVVEYGVPVVTVFGAPTRTVKNYNSLSLFAMFEDSNASATTTEIIFWGVHQYNILLTAIPNESNDSSKFFVSPYKFDCGGVYQVKVTVQNTVSTMSSTKAVTLYIDLPQSADLIAIIAQGSSLSLSQYESVVLDGSQSFDRTVPPAKRVADDELNFTWSCAQYDSVPRFTTQCPSSYYSSLPKISVTGNMFSSGTTLVMTLTVAKGSLSNFATISILIQNSSCCSISIAPLAAMEAINIGRKQKVQSTIRSRYAALLKWTFSDNIGVNISSVMETGLSRQIGSSDIWNFSMVDVIRANSLLPNSKFTLRLWCSSPLGSIESGFADIDIQTNSPPALGSFSLTPSIGIELQESFLMLAMGWVSSELPISYEFAIESTVRSAVIPLRGQSEMSYFLTHLPAGDRIKDYALTCICFVYDALGGNSSAFTVANVLQSNLSSHQLTMYMANASLKTSDDMKSYISVYSSILNYPNCSISPNCSLLNRYQCVGDNTCGSCWPSYIGTTGPSNSICLLTSSRRNLLLTANKSSLVGSICGTANVSSSRCHFFEQCINGECIVSNKSCVNNCNGHGHCQWISTDSGRPVNDCSFFDTSCEPVCVCNSHFYGIHCSLSHSEYSDMLLAQERLLTVYSRLLLIDNANFASISKWVSMLSAITYSPERLSPLMLPSVSSCITTNVQAIIDHVIPYEISEQLSIPMSGLVGSLQRNSTPFVAETMARSIPAMFELWSTSICDDLVVSQKVSISTPQFYFTVQSSEWQIGKNISVATSKEKNTDGLTKSNLVLSTAESTGKGSVSFSVVNLQGGNIFTKNKSLGNSNPAIIFLNGVSSSSNGPSGISYMISMQNFRTETNLENSCTDLYSVLNLTRTVECSLFAQNSSLSICKCVQKGKRFQPSVTFGVFITSHESNLLDPIPSRNAVSSMTPTVVASSVVITLSTYYLLMFVVLVFFIVEDFKTFNKNKKVHLHGEVSTKLNAIHQSLADSARSLLHDRMPIFLSSNSRVFDVLRKKHKFFGSEKLGDVTSVRSLHILNIFSTINLTLLVIFFLMGAVVRNCEKLCGMSSSSFTCASRRWIFDTSSPVCRWDVKASRCNFTSISSSFLTLLALSVLSALVITPVGACIDYCFHKISCMLHTNYSTKEEPENLNDLDHPFNCNACSKFDDDSYIDVLFKQITSVDEALSAEDGMTFKRWFQEYFKRMKFRSASARNSTFNPPKKVRMVHPLSVDKESLKRSLDAIRVEEVRHRKVLLSMNAVHRGVRLISIYLVERLPPLAGKLLEITLSRDVPHQWDVSLTSRLVVFVSILSANIAVSTVILRFALSFSTQEQALYSYVCLMYILVDVILASSLSTAIHRHWVPMVAKKAASAIFEELQSAEVSFEASKNLFSTEDIEGVPLQLQPQGDEDVSRLFEFNGLLLSYRLAKRFQNLRESRIIEVMESPARQYHNFLEYSQHLQTSSNVNMKESVYLSFVLLMCISSPVLAQDVFVHGVCLGMIWAVLVALAFMYVVQPAATWSVVVLVLLIAIALYFYKSRYSVAPAAEENDSDDRLGHTSEQQSPEKVLGTLPSCDIVSLDDVDEGDFRHAEYTTTEEIPTETLFTSLLANNFIDNSPALEEAPVDCSKFQSLVNPATDKAMVLQKSMHLKDGMERDNSNEEQKFTEADNLRQIVDISSSSSEDLSSSDVSSDSEFLDSSGSTVNVDQQYCGLDGKVYRHLDDINLSDIATNQNVPTTVLEEMLRSEVVAIDSDVFNFDSSSSSSSSEHGEDAYKFFDDIRNDNNNDLEKSADILVSNENLFDFDSSRSSSSMDRNANSPTVGNDLFDFGSSGDDSSESSFHMKAQASHPSMYSSDGFAATDRNGVSESPRERS